jgi:hypothetical protein
LRATAVAAAITPAAAAAVLVATATAAADVLPPPLVAYATVGDPLPNQIARTLQLQHRVLVLLSFVLCEAPRQILLLLHVLDIAQSH